MVITSPVIAGEHVMLGEQATKRFVTVEKLMELTVFLCSEVGGSISGTGIAIDGGWTAH